MVQQIPVFPFLWQYVEHWAEVMPDDPALRIEDTVISYRELAEQSRRLAAYWLSQGVGRGDRIVTVLPSIPAYVVSLLAAGQIGAILVPMDVRYQAAELRRLINHVEPQALVAVDRAGEYDVAGVLEQLQADLANIHTLTVGSSGPGIPWKQVLPPLTGARERLEAARAAVTPDDGALVVFTGGTTGVPKAALLSHRNVTTMCYLETEYFHRWLGESAGEDRLKSLAALPPSHVGGTLELIGTALVGGWELLMMASWSPYPVLEATARERIPLMGGVPTMYAILLSLPDLDRFDLSCLKVAVLSGERVSQELLEGIRDRICPNIVVGYGSTEAGAEVTFTEPGDDLRQLADGYVGKPLPGVEITIADEEGNPLPVGQVGEVLVRGPLTISGYFRMPTEDQAGFINGYCRTGDLGYLTPDGGLYILGRKKQIIRVGSYTVLPTEVEEVAASHPGVALAAAVGMPDPIFGEVVWLVVSPEPGHTVDVDALLARCRQQLADYKVPRRIVVRDDIPLTRIGKADRLALREVLLAEAAGCGS